MKTTFAAFLVIPLLGLSSLTAQTNPVAAPNGSNPPAGNCTHRKQMLANLTDAERAQLKSDMKQIRQDPQLVAARQAVQEAQTKEARQAAKKALHQTRRELLLKVDPSIEPVLDKINACKNPK